MNRTVMLGVTVFLGLVGIALLGGEKPAIAGHGCQGCYGGGSYGVSCYGGGGCHGAYDGCFGGNGCYGCVGRPRVVYRRHFAFRRHYACSGCSGYSCYGRADCDGGSSYGCAGCRGSYGCYGATSIDPSPAAPQVAVLGESAARTRAASHRVLLSVDVPADAKLFVNGHLTRSTGPQRQFVSHVPQLDQTYEFQVRAELVRDGEPVVETETARLQAGEQTAIRFAFHAAARAGLLSRRSSDAAGQLARRGDH